MKRGKNERDAEALSSPPAPPGSSAQHPAHTSHSPAKPRSVSPFFPSTHHTNTHTNTYTLSLLQHLSQTWARVAVPPYLSTKDEARAHTHPHTHTQCCSALVLPGLLPSLLATYCYPNSQRCEIQDLKQKFKMWLRNKFPCRLEVKKMSHSEYYQISKRIIIHLTPALLSCVIFTLTAQSHNIPTHDRLILIPTQFPP